MGLNFNVPLPGPFSYSARLGGKSKPNPELDRLRRRADQEWAKRDLHCPRHLGVSHLVEWITAGAFWLFAMMFVGFGWAILGLIPVAALVALLHRARHQRRAPHLAILKTGLHCLCCANERNDRTEKAKIKAGPLADLDQTQPIRRVAS